MSWNDDNSGNPWKSRKKNTGQPSEPGRNVPDIEDFLRRGGGRLRDKFFGKKIGFGGGLFLSGIALLVWLASGLYTVLPDEIGVETVFGKFSNVTQPGLNYNWPFPVGDVYKERIGVRSITIGKASGFNSDVLSERLMLTGDENIVEIEFTILWRIDEQKPNDFLFNLRAPAQTIKAVAEAVMREVIGKSNALQILTGARQNIESAVIDLMQKALDDYGAGVRIQQAQLQKADPPVEVIDSFRDVQAARADLERAQNEAQAYANKVIPEARGEASQIIQRAEAEKERILADARGEASYFLSLYEQYRLSPKLTRRRLYLETFEEIYKNTDKIIVDTKDGRGVLPYLPLDPLSGSRTLTK